MAIKSYKPTSPSRRQMTVTDYSELSKVAPEKSLLASLEKKQLWSYHCSSQRRRKQKKVQNHRFQER